MFWCLYSIKAQGHNVNWSFSSTLQPAQASPSLPISAKWSNKCGKALFSWMGMGPTFSRLKTNTTETCKITEAEKKVHVEPSFTKSPQNRAHRREDVWNQYKERVLTRLVLGFSKAGSEPGTAARGGCKTEAQKRNWVDSRTTGP